MTDVHGPQPPVFCANRHWWPTERGGTSQVCLALIFYPFPSHFVAVGMSDGASPVRGRPLCDHRVSRVDPNDQNLAEFSGLPFTIQALWSCRHRRILVQGMHTTSPTQPGATRLGHFVPRRSMATPTSSDQDLMFDSAWGRVLSPNIHSAYAVSRASYTDNRRRREASHIDFTWDGFPRQCVSCAVRLRFLVAMPM